MTLTWRWLRSWAAAACVSMIAVTSSSAADAPILRLKRFTLLDSSIPSDMAFPDGRSRWQMETIVPSVRTERTIYLEGAVVLVEDRDAEGRLVESTRWTGAAEAWVLPHRGERLAMGSRNSLLVEASRAGSIERHRFDTEIVGIGWLHLPSGPREVVLQRVADSTVSADGTAVVLDRVAYRWIDPRAGVVAEAGGPAAGDGRAPLTLESASAVEEVITGAADLKVYVDQIDRPQFSDVLYGWDRGSGTSVSSLTPNAYTTIGDLIAANSWDFSVNTSGTEVAATFAPINASETCNWNRCGYTSLPNTGFTPTLERRDRAFDNPTNLLKYNTSRQRENRASDVVLWLRAATQKEGKSGIFGTGETGVCFSNFGTTTRTPVPEWVFSHQDANGFYMQAGDTYSAGPFNCEQNLFNRNCGTAGLFPDLWAKACGSRTGTQTGVVLKGGVVTTPSGHTLNALLSRIVADYCVYSASGCSFLAKLDEANTVVYLWTAPYLGSIARIQSAQIAPDNTSWTTVAETDFKFGLFPPRTITVTGTTSTSVSLSWDPGLDTHRINGYKVYWDTDSGSSTGYAFNSVNNPGQASIVGTTATISGLTTGQTYYFTVTSRSNFTDPSTNVTTTYESLLYPTQVSGDPSFVYPIEVQGATTCIPTAEVTGLTVTKDPGGIKVCWGASVDPCTVGYQVLGANSPTSDANFTPIADVGLTNCWVGDPAQTYFLVIAKGSGGNGPWGHYGH